MSREYECVVTRVVDGDTLDVEVDLGFDIVTKQRVRLLGVDTPETYRPSCEAERAHGEKAKEFVQGECLGKKCKIVTDRDRKGKYGRYLGVVYPPGSSVSINDLIAQNGLAKLESYE
jgi:micrococcal nuclease